MPEGINIRPATKWTDVIELYDDGDYVAIWGNFDGSATRELGVRWKGEGEQMGYPSRGANALWHIEPRFLVLPILFKLLDSTLAVDTPEDEERAINIKIAISEAYEK